VLAGVLVTLRVRVARVVVVVVLLVLRVLLVVVAVRVVAWAGRGDPMGPAAAVKMSRMAQASATHADQVRTRMVPSLSFRGDKR
jgi:hypothetical protein